MAIGTAAGENRASRPRSSDQQQVAGRDIDGARASCSTSRRPSMTLFEVNQAARSSKATAHPDVNLIFGAVVDENMKDELRITVIATGFDQPAPIVAKATAQAQRAASSCARARDGRANVAPARAPSSAPATPSPASPASPQPAPARASNVRPFNPNSECVFNDTDLDIPPFLRKR